MTTAELHPGHHVGEHRAARERTAFTGVAPLVRFVLRRDRVYLPVWVLALVGITYASAAAVRRTYDTPAEILSYARNVGASPASVAMAGPPVALDQIGGILVFETSLTAYLGVALMAVFTVVRHTRAEEDAGRVELLGSTVVSRHAVVAAAVLVAAGASLLVGLGITGAFLAEEQPVAESLLFGAAAAALGFVFTGVAGAAAQIMSHARGAIGASLALLGVAFALRAIGDVRDSFWSWLSPMGWSQQVRLYDDNRWWPLLLSLALTGLLLVGTVALENRRDLGAGIVTPRPGPAEAGWLLYGVVGLHVRLQRGVVVGWAVGLFALGLMFGSLSEEIENMVADNPTLRDYFAQSGAASIVDTFFATSMLLMAIAGSGFAVSSALRTRAEESAGRLEPVLAAAVSRTRWLLGAMTVTLVGAAVVVAAGGLGLGVAYAATGGSVEEIGRMTAYVLAYLPATLVLSGLAFALTGWLPRATALTWMVLALVFVVGWLGNLLRLPGWAEELSPFSHVPEVPAEDLTVAPVVWLSLVALGLAVAGLAGFRRRDIG